jgi:hypothetical protein
MHAHPRKNIKTGRLQIYLYLGIITQKVKKKLTQETGFELELILCGY